MMTVITHVTLTPGREPEWDAAMRDRLETARDKEGWVGNQLVIPLDAPNERTVIGTWTPAPRGRRGTPTRRSSRPASAWRVCRTARAT